MLAFALLAMVALDAVLVFVVPRLLGYPTGGIFLLDGLPFLAGALWIAAALAVPVLLASRKHVGPVGAFAFVAGLCALGAANAYLWMLCVASV